MEIKDMDNNTLLRQEEFIKRQLKTITSTLKQIEDERARRYDNGMLGEKRGECQDAI